MGESANIKRKVEDRTMRSGSHHTTPNRRKCEQEKSTAFTIGQAHTRKHGRGTQTLVSFGQRINPIHQHQDQRNVDNVVRRAKAPDAGKENVHAEAGLREAEGGKEGLSLAADPAAVVDRHDDARKEGELLIRWWHGD